MRPSLPATMATLALLLVPACSDDKDTTGTGTNTSSDAGAEGGDGGGGGGGTGGGKCSQLCASGGFSGGKQTDFGGGLVECQCAGTGSGIQKTACETYCSAFNVSPANSLLSGTDKCACDGTQKPGG